MARQSDESLDDLVRAVTALSYAMGRSRVHDQLTAAVGVRIDRPEVALLRVLCAGPEPLRITDLAERLLVRPPHVTRQAARLEQGGLIRRTPDARDHRAQLLTPTERGRTVVDRLNRGVRDTFREALTDVPDDELRAATKVIARLVADSAARLAPTAHESVQDGQQPPA
ncbi:MarR family winged helix-turn-helix transcriptional regulator [Streptomyces sp. DT24]|nr:MarR family transcriptional regulator [Streptomyces sp. AM 4-1-1]WEH32506.1 MarR family transcriptional regulator [Streptomyces sp. AM 4-1-1]